MKLSEKAWNSSLEIIETIKLHPFNQELMQGTLAKDKFAYYLEQDSLYLQDFARSLAIIASKAPLEYVRRFLRYAEETFVAEQEVVHEFFRKAFAFQETQLLTPATLSYTSYLLRVCSQEPVEVGLAAVLPCFWVYREVGLLTAKYNQPNNPYSRWIGTYSGDEFGTAVSEAVDIFDALAQTATDQTQARMLDAFYKSTCLEWHFWHDAYHQKAFDRLENNAYPS